MIQPSSKSCGEWRRERRSCPRTVGRARRLVRDRRSIEVELELLALRRPAPHDFRGGAADAGGDCEDLAGRIRSGCSERRRPRARSFPRGLLSELPRTHRIGCGRGQFPRGSKPRFSCIARAPSRTSAPAPIRQITKENQRNTEVGEKPGIGTRSCRLPDESGAPPLDAEAYLKLRVYQQIDDYYRPKAKENAKLAARFRWASIAVAGLAAVLSALATFAQTAGSTSLGPWVAVLTTIGGSIATHAAAGRYDFQATTYFATARQLVDLARDWKASGKTAPSREWSGFVRDCEGAISAENRAWMAKLDQNRTCAPPFTPPWSAAARCPDRNCQTRGRRR